MHRRHLKAKAWSLIGAAARLACPVGARAASAVESDGKLVYGDPYPSTDSLHMPAMGRSEEFLFLRDSSAPRFFE